MRARALALLGASLSLGGCFGGNIADPAASLLDTPPPPRGPTGASGPTGATGPTGPITPPVDCRAPEPGRVTIHRLNRAEYDNTVRDLLVEDLRPAADFPPDDHGFGFDNIADVLATSPLLVEKYELAGANLVSRALEAGPSAQSARRFEAEVLTGSAGGDAGDAWNLFTNGEITATYPVTTAGEYQITVRAWATQAGTDSARMELRVDGQLVQGYDVPQGANAPGTFTARRMFAGGNRSVTVAFTNDFYEPPNDRNLLVDYVEIEGPLGVRPTEPAKRARIMICDPAASTAPACARQIFSAFGRRAWRRPLTTDELDRLVALAQVAWTENDPFDVGIGLGLQGILLSPKFTFRVEVDPDLAATAPRALDAHELATRLSYFVWSSMPDDTLGGLADSGELLRPEVLAAQVRRMVRDPKARALTENFAGQWLYTRAMPDVHPDYQTYPSWDDELATSMRAETEAFFHSFLVGDVSALDMIDADYSFIDDRLARHYGLTAPGSTTVQRTPLGADRRGLFTQGAILTVTSHARRTSPVKRGKWVMEQLLCTAPPAPPPGVEGIPEEVNPNASLRDRFEQHRANPTCASCHAIMDPIGFSLEHFDGVGAFRTKDSGYDIDASAVLPDGRSWDGALGLASALKADARVPRCMTEKLFTYALGRGATVEDRRCGLPAIEAGFAASGYRMEQLVTQIVTSPAFTKRRPEGN
jgi:hypothetical protein